MDDTIPHVVFVGSSHEIAPPVLTVQMFERGAQCKSRTACILARDPVENHFDNPVACHKPLHRAPLLCFIETFSHQREAMARSESASLNFIRCQCRICGDGPCMRALTDHNP